MRKPGACFAFKPLNNIPFDDQPGHLELRGNPRSNAARNYQKRHGVAHSTTIMVKERAPPKGPLRPINQNEDARPMAHRPEKHRSQELDPDFLTAQFDSLRVSDSSQRTQSRNQAGLQRYSDDDDLDAFFSNIRRSHDPFSSSSSGHPAFGHHPKVMSSRKQKAAGVFNERRSRPEHHRDHRISVPSVPIYQDRKPEPTNLFSSIGPDAHPANYKPKTTFGEPEFYTDPAKASADLKALLEGGLDEDAEDNNQDASKEDMEKGQLRRDGTLEGLKVKLLPHQVEGVEWMRGRELGPVKRGRVPKGGILADDMGLGKTLQTIALILRNQKPGTDEEGWKEHFSRTEKTTLVVAPLALIRQWEAEIKDKVAKSHGLKVCVHHGPQRTKRFKDLALYDVVVTTYQVLVSEFGQSSDKDDGLKVGCFGLHWWRVVLDEAHTIKNRNAKSTKACYALRSEYRWCLSGTPMQNSLEELQSLIRFLRIRPFDNLTEWKEQIEKPIKSGKGHDAIRQLHGVLRCFMKRRTKDILKVDGALNPGGKPNGDGDGEGGEGGTSSTGFKVTERKVVTVSAAFSPAERRFYDRLEARADESIERMMQGGMNYANALVLLLRLRQACNHPKLVEGKLDKDRDALSGGDASQKALDAEVDSLADMFGGMGIVAKTCSICGRNLPVDVAKSDQDMCAECYGDLAYFNENETPKRKKPKRKAGKVKKVVKEVKVEKTEESPRGKQEKQQQQQRRAIRNRNMVIDSDDEDDEEGSWLVPEDQRGQLRLGKAGGEEDENCEGGGEWLGNDDSLHPSEGDDDDSQLDSFVVPDEPVKDEDERVYESDDTFPSLADLPARKSEAPRRSLSEEDSDSSASDDENNDDDDDDDDVSVDQSEMYSDDDRHHQPLARGQPGQILASAKIRQMMQILHKEAHEHKFIIFSQFTSMMDLVEPFFRKEGFKFTRYDGKMKNDEREASLHRLRNDKNTRILLCSLKCGSLGLNLTAATRVIILEPFWNPFIEEQAIDRVHRLTQTVDVIVYKLTVEKTVEERILDLQEKKRLLAETAIEGGTKKEFLKLGFDEIMDLFRRGTRPADAPAASQGRREPAGASGRWSQAAPVSASSLSPAVKKKGRRTEDDIYGRRW